MRTPRISVVIPTRDRPALLARAVASVLAQTHEDLEVIVVDDGSHEHASRGLAHIDDARLRLVRLPAPFGVAAARNRGLAAAAGSHVTFLDDDDQADPTWLATFVAAFTEGADVVTCGVRYARPDGRVEDRMPDDDLGPAFGHVSALFLAGSYATSRELLISIGGFDQHLRYAENTEIGLRLVEACRARGLTLRTILAPLVTVHVRGARAYDVARLDAARTLLDRHRTSFAGDPSASASLQTVAGVAAARLGLRRQSLRHLARAVRARPTRWKSWGRLLVATVPPLRRRIWGRAP